MDFSTRYAKLNAAQKQAVDTIDGPVMVVAGPGTGKTELLSMRAANILQKTDTLPENILCLTFTESGASAMRERMVQIIGKEAYKVAIHTFHSFGAEIINQNGDFFYHGATFRAADELSSYELLRGIFDELEYSSPLAGKMNGEYTHLGDALMTISELKKSGLTSDELLLLLDANDQVIDVSEPLLGVAFGPKISKTTADALRPLVDPIRSSGTRIPLPNIVPLSHIIADSLQHAIDQADTTNSTKPITAWRNAWMKKNEIGDFVLKTRDRQLKLRAVSFIYYQYLARMQESELYDFDDMILRVVHAMEVFPALQLNLQEKHQYIMVDEFQDTNMAQMRILYNLTNNEANNGRPNILVVGDDDQAIYSFQGADISNIINFRQTYSDVTTITLTDNYRSAAPILDRAREVITQGDSRLENIIPELDKTLTAHRSQTGSTIHLLETETKHDERQLLVQSIKERIDSGQPPETIAVLARRHHEIISLLPYFANANINVNYERRDNVLDIDPIIALEKMATLLVALFESRHDQANAILPELLAHPAFGFEPAAIWRLSLAAYGQRTSWMEVMAITPAFVPLHSWLITVAGQVPHTPLEYILDTIMGRSTPDDCEFTSPFFEYFFPLDKLKTQPDEYLVYLEALRTIRTKLRDYQPQQTPTLRTLLEFIALHRQLGSVITSIRPHINRQQGAINLMTAHKSKGLEFDTVYIIGAIDSAWGERVRSRSRLISYPENLPLTPSGDNLNERMRLFFVAMTRARKHLIISYSTSDDSGKNTLCASFLLSTSLQPETIDFEHDNTQLVTSAELRWYEPIISLSTGTMQELLAPTLENYKLSVTHFNNFLDVSRGGPQAFLMNNLLRFPQAMSPSAAYGSAIHKTLQQAHSHMAATKQQRPVEDVLRDFEQNLRSQHLSEADFAIYFQKGSDALNAFLTEKYASFSPLQKVELNFAGQQVMIDKAHLTGALDLVTISAEDKTIVVTDYKTGKASTSWTGKTDYEKIKLHKYKQQLMFYKLLIEHSRDYGQYTVTNGCLQFVEPTIRGEILSLEASCSAEELDTFRRLIQAVWHKIITLDLPDTSTYEQNYKGMLAFEQDLLGEH
ncbi:MAG TPA: ATP-dependent DNA helicase [Candidatus Saccharimonadales bacterium]|nr:ATP-dependent DNA helicase [Candidatus Saccharimonadales bacterium]